MNGVVARFKPHLFVTYSNSTDGVYSLKSNSTGEEYDVYCHMSDLGACGSGGWTLVMKVDGNQVTNKTKYILKVNII